MYLIGMDGGGTKTEAVLFHTEKGIICSLIDEATNPHSTTFDHSTDVVLRMVQKLLATQNLSRECEVHLSCGIAGLGRQEDKERWLALLNKKENLPYRLERIEVESDALIALYAGTYGTNGIASICGTGSITFGKNDRRSARTGGWGHLIGADPGSGYFIGSQGLKAVFDRYDGLISETKILPLMLEGEGVSEVTQLVRKVYDRKHEKEMIATFARYVFAAQEAGDEKAREIIERTAKDIASFGVHVHRKLFTENERVPFVLVGGVFKNKGMVDHIIKNTPDFLEVRHVTNRPVVGSIVHILLKLGYSTNYIKKILNHQIRGNVDV